MNESLIERLRLPVQMRDRTKIDAERLEAAAELERLSKDAQRLQEALKACAATFGHNHWDSTMQHGAGCDYCIRQREAGALADAAIEAHK